MADEKTIEAEVGVPQIVNVKFGASWALFKWKNPNKAVYCEVLTTVGQNIAKKIGTGEPLTQYEHFYHCQILKDGAKL